jgi:hypothetical protein
MSFFFSCAALQVQFVNDAIRKAKPGSKLHGLAPIADPSDEVLLHHERSDPHVPIRLPSHSLLTRSL